MSLKAQLKAEANRLGFSIFGVAAPKTTPHFENYVEWVSQGHHATLTFLSKDYVIQGREHPETLLEGAKSVLVAGIHTLPQISMQTITQPSQPPKGLIAAFGTAPDYHGILNQKFRQLSIYLKEISGPFFQSRLFIDSGPVMEKDMACQAGLGWIGRNSLLITPQFGSYCLIGCLFVNCEIPPDAPLEGDVCGDCQACLQACPTGCINNNRTIRTQDCISYQTIETADGFPENLKHKMGAWIFGCDVCQLACPVNQKILSRNPTLPSTALAAGLPQQIDLRAAEDWSSADFSSQFSHTPVARIGWETFLRNLQNAKCNQKDY